MPFQQGQTVLYIIGNLRGTTTGEQRGKRIEVEFGPADKRFVQEDHLVMIPPNMSLCQKFRGRLFQGIEDFRKTFGRIRLSGELTNMMYSMGNAKTDFYPHQFVPVLKFLSSARNRLLIADEVGLGKTIESMYIWQELRARDGSHKLLIVAPAVLKEKWCRDLEEHFDIEANQASAGEVLAVASRPDKPFALVTSLQGLRINDEFLEFLENNADAPGRHLFDLVVIDEAHYLRNEDTKSFKLGCLLRDHSENLVLLSATPIQTGSNNFFNLLRLLAPDEFSAEYVFEEQLEKCKALVRLANALDQKSPKEIVRDLLVKALNSDALQGGSQLNEIKRHFDEYAPDGESEDARKKRLMWIEELKNRYFYYPWVCRMRKRDVLKDRPLRKAITIDFQLSEIEDRFYKAVSAHLLRQEDGSSDFSTFRLIARQRQMASCIPAALRTWRKESVSADQSHSEEDDFLFDEYEFGELARPHGTAVPMPSFPEFNLDELERNDSKFNRVFAEIKTLLENDPQEKIIVFSFFRGTVTYLFEILLNLGVSSELIIGGLSPEEKTERIERFKNTPSINVLLSTEVGSEGIDLQFARVEINYDLPWNPMRVEQRIGRIDRIGQQKQILLIYNAFCSSTIEDRVLRRLHERIRTFQDVLGGLEEILGPTIKDFELSVFRRGERLTEAEIADMEKRLDDVETRQKLLIENLKDRSALLSEYEQCVLNGIEQSRESNRMLSGRETAFLIKEFLNWKYPGSSVQNGPEPGTKRIVLSAPARTALSSFLAQNPQVAKTDLAFSREDIVCAFDGCPNGASKRIENIDINHGLVRWMVSEWKTVDIGWGCSSVSVPFSATKSFDVVPGQYVYFVQQWRSQGAGAPRTNELKFFATESGSGKILPGESAERLLTTVLLEGRSVDCPPALMDESSVASKTANEIGAQLYNAAWDAEESFEAWRRRFVQDTKAGRIVYLDRFYQEKEQRLEKLIQTQKEEGKAPGIIRANEGKLEKIKADHSKKVHEVEKAETVFEPAEIAIGIIQVTED